MIARLAGLIRKESLQVMRDPAALLIAFVLPLLLLFLFAYAVSLDIRRLPVGLVVQSDGPAATELAMAFDANPWLLVTRARDRRAFEPALIAGTLDGMIVIPADFESLLVSGRAPLIQIITDGSAPNTANFVAAYATGVIESWRSGYHTDEPALGPAITLQPRFWFNPELDSRRVLLPGALGIVMTIIGTLLTALVVAREWERGTMEALMSTPASMPEIIGAKLAPYFVLGLIAIALCTLICLWLFGLPLRGSPFTLLLISAVFLIPALGQGLVISALAKNQFIAAQIALLTGFLPAFLLSGFLFEIASMPAPIRLLTYVVSARWYIEGLQTVFLAGDIWPLLLRDMGMLLVIGAVFIAGAARASVRSLD